MHPYIMLIIFLATQQCLGYGTALSPGVTHVQQQQEAPGVSETLTRVNTVEAIAQIYRFQELIT